MSKKKLNIEEIISIIFYLIPIIIFVYLIMHRFSLRVPREIFNPISFEKGVLYLSLFLTNLTLLIIIISNIIRVSKKYTLFVEFILDIQHWIKESKKLTIKMILKIPHIEYPISLITVKFIKIPSEVYRILSYIIHISLMVALSLDILYLEKFFLTYYIIYLYLIELLVYGTIKLCLETNNTIMNEISKSWVIINIEKAINNPTDLNENDYKLTEYNTEYDSVTQIMQINDLVSEESAILNNIIFYLEKPFYFLLIKRIVYTSLWSYVFWFYPFPVIKAVFLLMYYYGKIYIPYIVFVIFLYIINYNHKK